MNGERARGYRVQALCKRSGNTLRKGVWRSRDDAMGEELRRLETIAVMWGWDSAPNGDCGI